MNKLGSIWFLEKIIPNVKSWIIIFLFIIILFNNFGHSQSNRIQNYNSNDLKIGDSTKVKTLLSNAQQSWLKADTFNAKILADSAYSLSTKISYQFGIKEACSFLGIYNNRQGDYRRAFDFAQQALSISEKLFDRAGIAKELGNIGNIYSAIGNLSSAVDNYLNALKIAEELGLSYSMAVQYINIGNIQDKKGDLLKALAYFQKAKSIADSIPENDLQQTILGNIGYIYSKLGEEIKAIEYYNLAMDHAESKNDKLSIAALLSHYGSSYFHQKDYNKSSQAYDQAIIIFRHFGDLQGISQCLINMGAISITTGKNEKALTYLNQAIELASQIQSYEILEVANKALSELYRNQNMHSKALDYYTKAMFFHDTLTKLEKNSEITRKELNYEFEKKEFAIKALHDQELALTEEKRKSQRFFTFFILIGFFIAGGGGFYIYRSRQFYLFDQKVGELRQKALNAQMSDHFISNTMDSINRFIENSDREKASEYLLLFSRLIREVLQNSFEGTVSLKSDLSILEKYIELEKLRFPKDSLNCHIDIALDIDPENITVPPMVMQVLVENSIKHGFNKTNGGTIKISIGRKNDKLNIIAEDNGFGRKFIQTESNASSRKSFGTDLAQDLINVFGKARGETKYFIIDLKNEENEAIGTRVDISIPYIEYS